jgi:hypothetical protein
VSITINLKGSISHVGRHHLQQHIKDAIGTTCGMNPEDPLFKAISNVQCGPVRVMKRKRRNGDFPPTDDELRDALYGKVLDE